jgi:hypothetical protein
MDSIFKYFSNKSQSKCQAVEILSVKEKQYLAHDISHQHNLYHPKTPHAAFQNVLVNGVACHMPISVCLLGSSLNVHAMAEKLRPSRGTVGI